MLSIKNLRNSIFFRQFDENSPEALGFSSLWSSKMESDKGNCVLFLPCPKQNIEAIVMSGGIHSAQSEVHHHRRNTLVTCFNVFTQCLRLHLTEKTRVRVFSLNTASCWPGGSPHHWSLHCLRCCPVCCLLTTGESRRRVSRQWPVTPGAWPECPASQGPRPRAPGLGLPATCGTTPDTEIRGDRDRGDIRPGTAITLSRAIKVQESP